MYRAHPDWVLHFPGRPRSESRQQLILDFGRPEVVAYILAALDALVRENGVDFFKWDMNRYASEPGSVAGKAIWRRHVEGFYHIIDELRRAHPTLNVQSCSGGGGRIDLGVLARATDQVWTSDNTDAHDRTFIQDGFSLVYPPRAMESWVTHATNHQTGRLSSLDLPFRRGHARRVGHRFRAQHAAGGRTGGLPPEDRVLQNHPARGAGGRPSTGSTPPCRQADRSGT